MGMLEKAGAVLVLVLLAFGAGVWWEYEKWQDDIAMRNALVQAERARSAQQLQTLREKYDEDRKIAESAAGRAAVADWLRRHGLLPNGVPVCRGTGGQTSVPGGAHQTPSEQGAAGRVEEFAARCVDDARRVELCAEWASREGLPIAR